MPSITCEEDQYLYRIQTFDDGGDGWDLCEYTIKTKANQTVVTTGTMAYGSYDQDWECVDDGRFELTVKSCDAESEISMKILDAHGGYAVCLDVPCAVSFKLAYGHIEAAPTVAPTTWSPTTHVPEPQPTLTPTEAPTEIPTTSPSPEPSVPPTHIARRRAIMGLTARRRLRTTPTTLPSLRRRTTTTTR